MAVVVVAVACVLVFVVFQDEVFGGSGPEKTFENMFDAMEAKDVEASSPSWTPGPGELEQQGMSIDGRSRPCWPRR